ncbi:MAG: hypothetical protein ACTHJR_11675 [Sphingomonas sp.]|uniref:hypothetical protein n=1 Tax=Sphingomonas sp. TaxID=28214 RepID=UPI003F7DCC8E
MFGDTQDDPISWTNYSPSPHPAEVQRMAELVRDPIRATSLLAFGLRPFGTMDRDPYNQPKGLHGPWVPEYGDLNAEPMLVDTATGWRYRVAVGGAELVLDLPSSNNFMEAQELLAFASNKKGTLEQTPHFVPAVRGGEEIDFPIVPPIELKADSRDELEKHIADLTDHFCSQLPVKRLWLRGQRREYPWVRDKALSHRLYGRSLPSLTPSLERYAKSNPEKMNFGFAWVGPNHWWKKPFMIWLMLQNAHWFAHDERFLPLLNDILSDPNDERFAELMVKIQLSPVEVGDPPHLPWPDEVDDLRQWFFLSMKRRQFAITMQQYGYYTSLLDLTYDLDVALYFTQASMVDGKMRCAPPQAGRVIYVFAESRGDFYDHGAELFWGTDGWRCEQPPRLERQKAGFIKGATNRNQNFYGNMIVARITLGSTEPRTGLVDTDLFPLETNDLLYATLAASCPPLEGLY